MPDYAWHESPGNVAALCRWLANERGWDAHDMTGVIDKPWHFADEWEQFSEYAAANMDGQEIQVGGYVYRLTLIGKAVPA